MASAVISAIGKLIKVGQTVYSYYEANNAKATITLADAVRLGNSVNVKLFAGNEFARIQTARGRFYDIYLPSITARSSIRKADITGSGSLTSTYNSIRSEGDAVWESLQKLAWIFTNNVLHVDDYNFFARLIGQGHVLLLHMHAVILNLRSVELLDRVDLDNFNLLPETLTLALYLSTGLQQVTDMDNRVRNLRLGQISGVSTQYIKVGNMTYRLYSWADSYAKLSSTANDQAINGDKVPARYSDQSSIYKDPYNQVVSKRNERVEYIRGIYNALTGDFLADVIKEQKELQPVIDRRVAQQTANSDEVLLKTIVVEAPPEIEGVVVGDEAAAEAATEEK
ncbi:hypothetical protein GSI_05835 [Ganoderma sinense ZZ0214-1]|uniref:Uncharacterized protein n=1 Tax=Ganoderma sinense ZZ0214-1 TaxID=1077348 RepID=A0A2G8SBK2_9APHY|nr:hypothetical protein GSI_05835 [Ganoderma sinense ZZ0214-1]